MAPSVVLVQGGEKSQHPKLTKETSASVENYPESLRTRVARKPHVRPPSLSSCHPFRRIKVVSVRSLLGLMQYISGASAVLMAVVPPRESLFAEVPPGVKVGKAPLQN